MKKKILFFISLLLAKAAIAQTPQEIINNYIEATGGKEKYNFNAYQFKRSYTANAATDFSEVVTVVVSENKFSKVKSIMDRDFYYILNDVLGWIKIPMGSRDKAPTYSVKDLNAKEKEDLKQEITDGIWPFIDFEKKGYKTSGNVSTTTLDGVACSGLVLEKEGIKREYFFDKTTGLLKREITTEAGITNTYDILKYNTVTGLKYVSEASYINTKDKKKTQVLTTLKLENPTLGVSFTK
jgi:putative salt-induced outer membrane protein